MPFFLLSHQAVLHLLVANQVCKSPKVSLPPMRAATYGTVAMPFVACLVENVRKSVFPPRPHAVVRHQVGHEPVTLARMSTQGRKSHLQCRTVADTGSTLVKFDGRRTNDARVSSAFWWR